MALNGLICAEVQSLTHSLEVADTDATSGWLVYNCEWSRVVTAYRHGLSQVALRSRRNSRIDSLRDKEEIRKFWDLSGSCAPSCMELMYITVSRPYLVMEFPLVKFYYGSRTVFVGGAVLKSKRAWRSEKWAIGSDPNGIPDPWFELCSECIDQLLDGCMLSHCRKYEFRL